MCWGGEGLDRWIETAKEEVERKAACEKACDIREKLRGVHDGGNAFINPYAFVPPPGKVKRGNPSCARVVEGIAEAGIELESTRRPLGQKEEMQHA